MRRKAFVLLSGGVDSTTCLYQALHDFKPADVSRESLHNIIDVGSLVDPIDWVEAVSIDYGQRHKKELEYARRSCDFLGIKHTILDVGNLLSGKTVMLSAESKDTVEVPNCSYDDIKGVSPTYVPFRNGLLLSAITAHAQKFVNEQIQQRTGDFTGMLKVDATKWATEEARDLVGIYFGAHAEDAANWAYPDCTAEFTGAMANAIYVGSYFTIRLNTPLNWLTKTRVVQLGDDLGVDWANTWSCYRGEEMHCGVCPTCRSRKQAFKDAGVFDPTKYAE